EGTLDRLALHASAMPKMRAEMRAEGIEDGELAALGAEEDKILAEIFERNDIAGFDLVVIGDLEPAARDRRGVITVDAHDSLKTRTCSTSCQASRKSTR